ncbi:hypothetical protein VP01_1162g8 [Puccinia sorghi]|uniref:Uncharacterized protein n=1 Tax=Puccinia sorghi TaxID=27349 RepID=A0A0L6VRH6_9BASI|nr:hypothetical protein VP01_1162g8 [Puccinia sorghi]
MLKWLIRLFIVLVAIIFVASANEEILYGGQQLVDASNKAASATTTGHAVFPPVERESRKADNALNTGKEARLQTMNESDDDLLTIGLGTRGAYPSYPSTFAQSSVLTQKPLDLANNHELFKFQSNYHRLFPSGFRLEHVNSQASSSTRRRELLSDLDKTRKTDASASTKHYIPFQTNPPESPSEPFNLGRKTQLQSDAPITQGPVANSVTQEQDGGRGTKRKIPNSWGNSLSLKTGVTSDENDEQESYAPQDFLSGFSSEKPTKFSAEEDHSSILQFIPQEIQQFSRISQLGSRTASYQNAGASGAPVLPQHNFFQSGNQGSLSENPEPIPQVSKITKPPQPETIMAVENYRSQIEGIKDYGRLKFNKDLFKGEGPHQLERENILRLLSSIPVPPPGKFLLTEDQLALACGVMRRRNEIKSTLTIPQIRGFMIVIQNWYQYWNIHAKIDVAKLNHGEEVSSFRFVFPLFLLYVEMIISIIPFKQDIPLEGQLDYPQEMRNAINSYLLFNKLINTPPENGDPTNLQKRRIAFKQSAHNFSRKPSGILWIFLEFWMESHYKAFWNYVKERNGFQATRQVKSFFNTIFINGIETLNQNLRYYLPHE